MALRYLIAKIAYGNASTAITKNDGLGEIWFGARNLSAKLTNKGDWVLSSGGCTRSCVWSSVRACEKEKNGIERESKGEEGGRGYLCVDSRESHCAPHISE